MHEKSIKAACLISYKIFPPQMGGEKGIALFYQYLEERIPLSILSIYENVQENHLSAPVIPLLGKNKKRRYINPFLFFKILHYLKKNGITHLIFEHPYYGWLAVLLKWFTNTKIIIHSHNIESLRFRSTGKWWWTILWNYEKMTHRIADLNFFITDEDRQYAIEKFKLEASKCHTITYGIETNRSPDTTDILNARKKIRDTYDIGEDKIIILFNGTLNYPPNLKALNIILTQINPKLITENINYCIIVCGKNLPDHLNGLENYRSQNIIYAGFVDDINQFFMASDIFINPVIEGGGIKTKIVEAIGLGTSVVSTFSGAIGIPATIAEDKLIVVKDEDWTGFANAILQTKINTRTPDKFYTHFHWGKITERVTHILNK